MPAAPFPGSQAARASAAPWGLPSVHGGHCHHLHLRGWGGPHGKGWERILTAQPNPPLRLRLPEPPTMWPEEDRHASSPQGCSILGEQGLSPLTCRQGAWGWVPVLPWRQRGARAGKASRRGSPGHLSQAVAPGTLSTKEQRLWRTNAYLTRVSAGSDQVSIWGFSLGGTEP